MGMPGERFRKTGVDKKQNLTWFMRHPLWRTCIAMVAVLAMGTFGYHYLEGWSLFDGFYMTIITITTIGFGEIHPLGFHGRIFTVFLVLIGMGVFFYALFTSSQLLIEGEVEKILTRRRSMKAVQRIKNHFVVCGFGRMGSFVCQQFHARGIPFVVVEIDPDVQDKVVQAGYLLVPGDATEEEVLLQANIMNASGLVALLNSDAANVYAVLTVADLNPRLQIVARAVEESAHKKLLHAGAHRVISPYQIGGFRIVIGILKPTVMSFLETALDNQQLGIELEEVQVARSSSYSGMRLADTDIRGELNLIIIAVKKHDGQMVFNPGPNTVIEDQDTLVAMGEQEHLDAFAKKAGMSI